MPNKSAKKRKHADDEGSSGTALQKRKLQMEEDLAQDEALTDFVFGGASSFLKSLEEAEAESPVKYDSGVGSGIESGESEPEHGGRKAAWTDEDDGIEVGEALDVQQRRLPNGGVNARSNKYQDLLRHKFCAAVGTPKWAELNNKPIEKDEDDDVLQSCGFIKDLKSNSLEFKKVTDLNVECKNEGYINAVEFHEGASVAMVAGNSGIFTIYAVDGKRNNKLHSTFLQKFPILCAKFVNHDEVILGSRHNYIYSFNLNTTKMNRINLPTGLTQAKLFVCTENHIAIAGKCGEIHLFDAHTKERIHILKQDGDVTALCFDPSGNTLYSHSNTGEISIFDIQTKRLKQRFQDEGTISGSAIAVCDQYLATGSAEGVVNVYEHNSTRPLKTFLNLTTPIVDVKFNASGEMLAFASSDIDTSIRLAHLATMTVYSNFPMFGTKLGYINRINFSPNGGFLALGNSKSAVALYRLKHFKNY